MRKLNCPYDAAEVNTSETNTFKNGGAKRVQDNQQKKLFNIKSGPLNSALITFAKQADIYISSDLVLTANKQSDKLKGNYSIEQALKQLLTDTALTFVKETNGSYRVVPANEKILTLAISQVDSLQETAKGLVNGYIAKRSSTGTKTDTAIIETPQSISVFTADRIEALGASRLTEALSYAPGVNVSPFGDMSQYDWLILRGFDAYSPGFYLDGMQLRNNGNWGLWLTENYGLERIELLRGPASVLYGQNGPGGLVNMVSKRPLAEDKKEIQLQLGSDAHKQISGDFSGALDNDGKWLCRLTALIRDAELSSEKLKK